MSPCTHLTSTHSASRTAPSTTRFLWSRVRLLPKSTMAWCIICQQDKCEETHQKGREEEQSVTKRNHQMFPLFRCAQTCLWSSNSQQTLESVKGIKGKKENGWILEFLSLICSRAVRSRGAEAAAAPLVAVRGCAWTQTCTSSVIHQWDLQLLSSHTSSDLVTFQCKDGCSVNKAACRPERLRAGGI